MLYGIILLVLTVAMVFFSAWLRVERMRKTKRLSLETKDTYLSRQVREVVSTAGGIYVSLTLAASFLKLELVEELMLMGIAFDPLAVLSLVLAIIQPLLWPNIQ